MKSRYPQHRAPSETCSGILPCLSPVVSSHSLEFLGLHLQNLSLCLCHHVVVSLHVLVFTFTKGDQSLDWGPTLVKLTIYICNDPVSQ